MGISLHYDAVTQRSHVVEWGPFVKWSRMSHRGFSKEFRQVVFTLMCIHYHRKSTAFSALQKDVLDIIFSYLSHSYNSDPFW